MGFNSGFKGLIQPKHVESFIVNINVNFNILKQFNCALVGLIRDLIISTVNVTLLMQSKFYRPTVSTQNKSSYDCVFYW